MSKSLKKKKFSATDHVVETLKQMMNNGELKVGDKLPNEMELCEMLGVSRSSLREGTKILVNIGYLEVRRGQGTYVADNFVKNIFNMMGFSHEGKNLDYFMSVRRVLECGCIRLIYDKLKKEQCDELEQMSLGIDCKKNDLETIIKLDKDFHNMLFQYTENPLMIKLYGMITQMVDYVMNSLMSYEEVSSDAREVHLRLVEALRKKDLNASVEAIDSHMQTIESYKNTYIGKE